MSPLGDSNIERVESVDKLIIPIINCTFVLKLNYGTQRNSSLQFFQIRFQVKVKRVIVRIFCSEILNFK